MYPGREIVYLRDWRISIEDLDAWPLPLSFKIAEGAEGSVWKVGLRGHQRVLKKSKVETGKKAHDESEIR